MDVALFALFLGFVVLMAWLWTTRIDTTSRSTDS